MMVVICCITGCFTSEQTQKMPLTNTRDVTFLPKEPKEGEDWLFNRNMGKIADNVKANLVEVKIGMTRVEVYKIMGSPMRTKKDAWEYHDLASNQTDSDLNFDTTDYIVLFTDGKVSAIKKKVRKVIMPHLDGTRKE